MFLDPSGNPVTQQVQSVAVTDASGNPVTGIEPKSKVLILFQKYLLLYELKRNLYFLILCCFRC